MQRHTRERIALHTVRVFAADSGWKRRAPRYDGARKERRLPLHEKRVDELLHQVVPNEFLGHENIHFGRAGSMGVRCGAEKIRTEHVRGE